jgi:hypothetical protein
VCVRACVGLYGEHDVYVFCISIYIYKICIFCIFVTTPLPFLYQTKIAEIS